jgi:hypothetical protein
MDVVRVNVDHYDESTHSLIVNFYGVENGIEYTTPNYAFQVANYNASDIDTIIKSIAQVGITYLQQLSAKQNLVNNNTLLDQLKNLNEANYNFTSDQLTPPSPQLMPINTGVADNLEVIL